jgi:hypothetical protein
MRCESAKDTFVWTEFIVCPASDSVLAEAGVCRYMILARPLFWRSRCLHLRAPIIRSIFGAVFLVGALKSRRWWARMATKTIYPTLTQCAVVATALKILLFPA